MAFDRINTRCQAKNGRSLPRIRISMKMCQFWSSDEGKDIKARTAAELLFVVFQLSKGIQAVYLSKLILLLFVLLKSDAFCSVSISLSYTLHTVQKWTMDDGVIYAHRTIPREWIKLFWCLQFQFDFRFVLPIFAWEQNEKSFPVRFCILPDIPFSFIVHVHLLISRNAETYYLTWMQSKMYSYLGRLHGGNAQRTWDHFECNFWIGAEKQIQNALCFGKLEGEQIDSHKDTSVITS